MTTITPDEMKSLETLFMSETGTPSILLMEHAAQGVAAAIARHAPKSARVLFLCGPGNNGGDGYAAARLWCSGGGQADVWEVTSAVRGDALTNRTLALLHGVRILPSADAVDVAEYAAVVDALYGTGLNHAIEGDAAILIHRLSDHPQIPVIAVDIPSGLDGTTGRALGADVVRAAETVTFHRIKQGLLLRQGVEYTGEITVQPILIRPGDDIDLGFDGLETLSPAALAPLFARTPALHKGDCGRAVIFCGSRGMVGAAAFCANACIRAGAGLTTLLCRESLLPMLQVLAPGATCVPLPETNGLLTPQAARITRETLDKADAACIGCGCGLTPDVTMLLRVFAEADCPIVWDADALTLLATHDGILPLKEEDIITPHPGEAARLLEQHVEFILDEPLDALSRLHDLCGCCVLLKDACVRRRRNVHQPLRHARAGERGQRRRVVRHPDGAAVPAESAVYVALHKRAGSVRRADSRPGGTSRGEALRRELFHPAGAD